jgi:tetratricopeptide (TPR) repeat protein
VRASRAAPSSKPVAALAKWAARAGHGTLALFLAFVAPTACGRHEPERPLERVPLEAKVAGCAAVRAGPVCEVAPEGAELRVLVPLESGAITVTAAGAALPAPATALPGGRRIAIALPKAAEGTARAIDVCVARGEKLACKAIATVAAARDERITRAIARRSANDPEGALAALAGVEEPEASRARAASLRARVALARGDTEAAIAGLSAGMEAHLAAGRLSDGGLDAFALAHTLVTRQNAFAKALAVLDRAAAATAGWDEGAAQIDYYRALALRDGGRPREALAALQTSARLALSLGMPVAHRHAREVEARLLQSLGHHEGAMRTFAEIQDGLAPDESPCVRAEVLSERGWSELMAVLAGALPKAPPELRGRLEEAERLFTSACPRPAEADNAAVNLALEALLAGDVERAAERVRALDASKRPLAAYVDVWRLDLAGRIALAQKRPRDALAAYDGLAARARAAVAPDPLLRALVGRGRALAALGKRDDAARAFGEAEDLLDDELAHLPAGEERAMFLSEQGASADALIELHAAAGRAEEALAAARRARSRNVRAALRMERVTALSPAERARFEAALGRYRAAREALAKDEEYAWQRPKDADREARTAREAAARTAREAMEEAFAVAGEAPAPQGAPPRPAAGEAWLFLHPAGERACRVIAATARGTRTFVAQASPSDPVEALGAALLAPLDDALGDVARLRVLTSGAWQSVDVHALPFRGKPLVAQASVVFALDLPPAAVADSPAAALVVANPEDDLPQAEREAARVRDRLRASGQVMELSGPAATKKAFVEDVAAASWLHFAGHGRYAAGWDSGLRLAEGVAFTVRDVLALPRGPRRVVLNGCETARSAPTRALDLGLPEAFVVRGAEEVVAAERPVADATAADLMEGLYAAAPPGDLAAALARAQRAAWEKGARGDWAAYRVIVR